MPDRAESPAPTAQAGAQPGVVPEIYRAYNFKLIVQGVTEGHFTECTGLGMRVEVIRYREGGTSQVVHCIPGQVEYADISLRYGLTASRELFDWFMSAVNGRVERKNVSVVMLDTSGVSEVMRWDLFNAWPTEWRGAVLNAVDHEVAIETLTLVFETLQRA